MIRTRYYSKIVLMAFILSHLYCGDAVFINPDATHQLIVHCVLFSSQSRQKILVSMIVENDGNIFMGINNVRTMVNNITFSLKNKFDDSDPYNYYSDSLIINPAEKYVLSIDSQEFPDVAGEVIAPGDFRILQPGGEKSIKWTQSKFAYGYNVEIESNEDSYSETVSDTIFHLPEAISPGKYSVHIEAFDKNYHDYFTLNKDRCGIAGGIGVMTAVICREDSVEIY